jgi:hypothetical protein
MEDDKKTLVSEETNSEVDITPLNEINNGFAVFLICIPIIGALFIDPLIYEMFGYDNIFPILIAYAILNVITITQDEKQLSIANIKINNGLIWGAIFVPVYCYLRGSALNKKYNLGGVNSQWVFLCWIGSAIISALITPINF